ncbi:transporter substrate-binding domain-containing protein [Phaeobacter sp. QD34_3]|uniref:transporter substrate-binding domain-containing protein n=1 Tax=unclassified Phaeobacter TaxID=2621772 RepID=UPI00406D34DB
MRYLRYSWLILLMLWGQAIWAQTLTVNTVTRPPFSMVENGQDTGFSIELVDALADRLGWSYEINRTDSFAEMLDGVRQGEVDLAAANISITAARETEMDFSQPVFESGLQIMVHAEDVRPPSLWRAMLSWDLAVAIGLAFVVLFGGGMLMWVFERRAQPYFDRPLNEAWFPSFWWALNLVVNGGFEERVPRTPIGRLFGVLLVISSLFVVSVFVAKITTAMTVEAITGKVNSVNDLYGQNVGTISGSTAAGFLDRRDIDFYGYTGLDELIDAFEGKKIDAVVFDAPVLNYYVSHQGESHGRTIGSAFLRENYGLLFPQGSPHTEEVNRALLALQEDGTYDQIYKRWFGGGN